MIVVKNPKTLKELIEEEDLICKRISNAKARFTEGIDLEYYKINIPELESKRVEIIRDIRSYFLNERPIFDEIKTERI